MKKNKMMRAASALLVAVLLTTCAVSGTFAKYVTEDSAGDSARVAKFGVVVTADGSLFAETYIDEPNTGDGITVQSIGALDAVDNENVDNVVAPGTNNADNAFTFSITGKPEVDVKVNVVVDADEDVYLKGATGTKYPDMTTGNQTDTFDLETTYYPVKYTLNKVSRDGGNKTLTPVTGCENVNLAALTSTLQGLTNTNIPANTDLSTIYGEYEITWKWAYDTTKDPGTDSNDKADTLLGALAAGTALTPDTTLTAGRDYNLNTGLTITITVTQID